MGRYVGTTQLYAHLFGTAGTIVSGGGTISGDQQSLMGTCINDAEDAIDTYTRRNYAGTTGTAYYSRYFQDRVRDKALYLDQDLFSLSSLTNGDGQSIPAGSVWLEPRNVGPPYRVLRLHSSYTYVWSTDTDVIISGTWGYGTVAPPAISEAAKLYAAHLYRLKDVGPGGVSGFTEGGEVTYPQGMPDTVKSLLSPFRSRSGGIV